jgi:hypothetical protein
VPCSATELQQPITLPREPSVAHVRHPPPAARPDA